MKLNFVGDIQKIKEGIQIFAKQYNFEINSSGMTVKVHKRKGNIEIGSNGDESYIFYEKKVHFFRALSIFIEKYQKIGKFKIVQKPEFKMTNVMFDCSRNAVLKISSLQKMLRLMASMGLSSMMLYLEDTYEIDSLEYFGYMRGRYTYSELKKADDYANIFGIEIFPYIQVLGHLKQALKWNYASEIRDTEDIVLVGEEKTYEIIEKMIKSSIKPFRSNKLGLGIDEAYNIGLGKYLKNNGYKDSLELVKKHLEKVMKIVNEYNLDIYLPSDMYLKMASKTDYYFDAGNISKEITDQIPENIKLVYWDYYHEEKDFYLKMIKKHEKFKRPISLCGGITLWSGMAVHYTKTFRSSIAALKASKEKNLDEITVAMFGDDCSESNYFGGLLGMGLYAEYAYNSNLDMSLIYERFKFCTGVDSQAFMALEEIDKPYNEIDSDLFVKNPSKYMLYQDILIGLFDKHLENLNFSNYYNRLSKKMKEYSVKYPKWEFLFGVHEKLCNVLSLKGDMGIRITKSYKEKNKEELEKISKNEIPQLQKKVDELRKAHRNQWMSTYKPFGWEVLDIRYGGIITRLDSAKKRIDDYLNDKIDIIEELEEKRLYFDDSVKNKKSKICGCNDYKRIVTGGLF